MLLRPARSASGFGFPVPPFLFSKGPVVSLSPAVHKCLFLEVFTPTVSSEPYCRPSLFIR